MPSIVAICPYCRAGGVRAPDTALGASAICPKCKSNFTVMPSDDIPPDWDKPLARPAPVAPVPPAARPLDETQPTGAIPDVTEPSPVLTADGSKNAGAAPQPATEPASEAEVDGPALADLGMVFALGSLCFIGPAMVATLFPFGRVIGLVLAAVGFVLGLLALGAEGRARLTGAAAALLHFVALMLLLFLPSWVGLDSWHGPEVAEAPKGPLAVESTNGAVRPVSPDEQLDAEKYAWRNGDALVSVRSGVGPVELLGPKGVKRTPKENFLHLMIRVRNAGFEKEIPLCGWAAGESADGVSVTDANGKALAPATFEAGWAPTARGRPAPRAVPGHFSEVVLVFTAPPAKTDFVRVQLSGAAVGTRDEIKFRAGTGPVVPRGPGQ